MKKYISAILLVLFLSYSIHAFAYEGDIKIFINGNELKVSEKPIIENGTTLVPMRNIFEALGMTVEWDGKTQTVTGIGNQATIKLTIGSKIAYVNHAEKELLLAPRIVNGTTMVPLRFISEAIGCKVDWNGETRTIEIYSNKDKGQLYAVSGEGPYEGYMLLRGYEGEEKFQIYFQGEADSFMTTIEDLRDINLDERITWKYKGITLTNTIRELYSLFSDSLRIMSLLNIEPGEELIDQWFIDVFGKVYLDWLDLMNISSKAPELVTEYFKQTGQLNTNRNNTLNPDSKVIIIEHDDKEEKQEEKALKERIRKLLESGGSVVE